VLSAPSTRTLSASDFRLRGWADTH
jgi:hypothetical protein